MIVSDVIYIIYVGYGYYRRYLWHYYHLENEQNIGIRTGFEYVGERENNTDNSFQF